MKTKEMEDFLEAMTRNMSNGLLSRKNNLCATCGSPSISYEDFRDDLSRKEFSISRMCQACQDSVFNNEFDEEDYPEDEKEPIF